jgi:hypothetical protein
VTRKMDSKSDRSSDLEDEKNLTRFFEELD